MHLHFKQMGTGMPIIILHGLLGMSDNWHSFARRLVDQFMIFNVDLRNHGRSPHEDLMDYTVMASDVRQFMEDQWLYDGAIIMGHSMGGKVAMQLALTEPDLVNKLVVMDIAPSSYNNRHGHILQALNSIQLDHVRSRKEVEDQLRELLEDQGVVLFLMKNLRRIDQSFEWRMNLPAITRAYTTLMKNIPAKGSFTKETIFIKGALSDYINDKNVEDIYHLFPKSTIQTIDAAGHWVHADQPERLYEILLSFIEK